MLTAASPGSKPPAADIHDLFSFSRCKVLWILSASNTSTWLLMHSSSKAGSTALHDRAMSGTAVEQSDSSPLCHLLLHTEASYSIPASKKTSSALQCTSASIAGLDQRQSQGSDEEKVREK